MVIIEIEDESLPVAKLNTGILNINGNSNILKIQRNHGIINLNGDSAHIYLDGGLDKLSEEHVTANDLLYLIVEVVELLIIMLIFYIIFSNVNF